MAAKKIAQQRGQALVEFIIFLPLMLAMYTLVVTLGDAINGSINQQKSTRAYFYFRMQNSPNITRPFRLGPAKFYESWQSFGHFWLGWTDYLEGGANGQPVAPCYKLNLPFGTGSGDKCDESYSRETTPFIRVGTVYGACGATYGKSSGAGGEYAEVPRDGNSDEMILGAISESSCVIR